MITFRQHSCRLCLSFKAHETFEVIDEFTRHALILVLSLQLKFDENEIYVMCTACSEKVKAAIEFKSTCLATRDAIFPYIDCENELQLDLQEIYMKEIENKQAINLPGEKKICSLCMQTAGDRFINVREEEVNAIHKFVPEMNMDVIKCPVLCKCCFDSLNTHSSFLNDCIELEKRIGCIEMSQPDIKLLDLSVKTEDIKTEVMEIEETQIKSEDIEIKSEEIQQSDTSCQNLKYESVECTTHIATSDMDYLDVQMYKCDFCDYKTTLKEYLKEHVLTHKVVPEEKMYKCDLCDYKTTYKRYLTLHQLTHKHMPQEQMYKCDLCDYKAKRKRHLAQHKLKHKVVPEEQMYRCDSCDYKAKRKRYLVQHQLKHKVVTEEQMLKCDLCEYKTVYKQYFACHQLKHKVVSEEQMYRCDLCDYNTIYKSCLTRHQLRHKDVPEERMYKCDLCGYKTIYKSNFARHQLQHKIVPQEQMR